MPRQNTTYDSRKQTICIPSVALADIKAEAERMDRSVSWGLQRAWMLARDRIKAMAGVESAE